MNMRTYVATVRKLHAAYAALSAAAESAEFHEGQYLAKVMDGLRSAPDEMQVQVCNRCDKRGNYSTPNGEWFTNCPHPDVPRFDVRTGKQIA
jgi:hypothetical protein